MECSTEDRWKMSCLKPDRGNLAVRDFREGSGNLDHGPLALQGVIALLGNPPSVECRA